MREFELLVAELTLQIAALQNLMIEKKMITKDELVNELVKLASNINTTLGYVKKGSN